MWELNEVEDGLFSPLLLSYYDLPQALRQCFSYCAIFPKDHKIDKDLLIKLWMAQGYLGEAQGNEAEIVGEEYFDNLIARSFFQEFEKDEDDSIIECKMHDIVHDFAQLLRKGECALVPASNNAIEEPRVESYDNNNNVRHLTLTSDEHLGILHPMSNVKKLRSLLVGPTVSTWEPFLPELFNQTCLRMLNLSYPRNSIKRLPHQIGNLIHLKYLNLEGNVQLFELPEALCDLHNLQTLNIRRCDNLRKLPSGIGKLINLRHLQNSIIYHVEFMPKGMERLTCLQTLEEYVLKRSGKGTNGSDQSSLADLGKLIHLRGNLRIKGLGTVEEASEAREARLSTRTGLRSLSLSFSGGDYKDPRRRIEDDALLLQALHPPSHLQILRIWYYKGPDFAFPNWITSLKSVTLSRCENWESLPSMGKLASLESLTIEWMLKVKKVGREFLGSLSSVNHHNDIVAYFPSLKYLEFRFMERWEEWEYELRSRGVASDDSCPNNNNQSIIMPKLQCFSIEYCPNLKTLPPHILQSRALQKLNISYCPTLFGRYNKETGYDWPSISHIPKVEILNRR